MRLCLSIIFFFLVGSLQVSIAQNQTGSNLSQEDITALQEEIGLYDTKQVLRVKRFEPSNKSKSKDNRPRSSSGLFGSKILSLVNILVYILIGVFLIGMIILVLGDQKKNKKLKELAEAKEKELENIEDLDPDVEIENALKAGDYRKAIRMQFYKVLQRLDHKEIIEWKIDKTNREFYREISRKELKSSFRLLANIYEQIWYGDKHIDFETYSSLVKHYDLFHQLPLNAS